MYIKTIVTTAMLLSVLSVVSWADTAVSIQVTAGPTLTEDGTAVVNLRLPDRLSEAAPLNVGDLVFFESVEPYVQGEGNVTSVYETSDEEITKAVILDHATHP